MKTWEFTLMATSHSVNMTLEAPHELSDQTLVWDFLMLFAEEENMDYKNNVGKIKAEQRNTEALRSRVEELIAKYATIHKNIFQLRTYLQKLEEGEAFLIYPSQNLSKEQVFNIHNYLASLRDSTDFNEDKKQFEELFGEVFEKYDVKAVHGNMKSYIGEQKKEKRVCRFCKNTREPLSFKNVAHAISESLGNKKVVLHEECDGCNSEFGSAKGIESSLIHYLQYLWGKR